MLANEFKGKVSGPEALERIRYDLASSEKFVLQLEDSDSKAHLLRCINHLKSLLPAKKKGEENA